MNSDDGWSNEGPCIISAQQREAIERAFDGSSLIVEHRFYYGSRAPKVTVFEDYEDFKEYLRENARPGDNFVCWRYSDVCRDENIVTWGKYPDEHGRTPRGGAY